MSRWTGEDASLESWDLLGDAVAGEEDLDASLDTADGLPDRLVSKREWAHYCWGGGAHEEAIETMHAVVVEVVRWDGPDDPRALRMTLEWAAMLGTRPGGLLRARALVSFVQRGAVAGGHEPLQELTARVRHFLEQSGSRRVLHTLLAPPGALEP